MGTGTLNWGTATAMANWDGITTGGPPQGVTGLVLERVGLTGSFSPEMGDLAA